MDLKKITKLKKKLSSRLRSLNNYYEMISGQSMTDYDVQAETVKLRPNQFMFDYMYATAFRRTDWWNRALTLYEDERDLYFIASMSDKTAGDKAMKKANKFPSERTVRDQLVALKDENDYHVSSRALQFAVKDVFVAINSHINRPDHFKAPKHKEFSKIQPCFKSDRVRIKNGRLYLDKPKAITDDRWRSIQMYGHRIDLETMDDVHPALVSFYLKHGQWYANIVYRVKKHDYLHDYYNDSVKSTGVDLNVHKFVDSDTVDHVKDAFDPCPKYLDKMYKQLSWMDHRIARRKRLNEQLDIKDSKNLARLMRKRRDIYRQIKFIQTDLCQKYTNKLVNDYTDITIEDLNVAGMKVSHKCKNTQRAMFGIFRRTLTYKARWRGVTLNFADQKYPSTQRCCTCGLVKTGDEKITLYGNKKHGTTHDQYICYNPDCPNYNKDQKRDCNAERNLDQLNFYSLIATLLIFSMTGQPFLCNDNYELLLRN